MPFAVYRLNPDENGNYPGTRTPIGVHPGDDREQAAADIGHHFDRFTHGRDRWDIEHVTEDQAEAIRAQIAPGAAS